MPIVPTAFNTWGVPQGDGAILKSGHAAWENLASSGANSCVIIAAWIPDQRVLALCHFDIFTNLIGSVWSKIDELRQGSTVELHMASNFFKKLATSTPHADIINSFDNLSYANSLTTYRSLLLAVSAQDGDSTAALRPQNMHMDSDSNQWMFAKQGSGQQGRKPIAWKTVGAKEKKKLDYLL